MYYVYILKSKFTDEIYIGSTNDLKRRLKEHNNGAEISTKRYAPWIIYYYEAYFLEELARLREKKLKYNGNAIRELKIRIGLMDLKKGSPSTTFVPLSLEQKNSIVRNSKSINEHVKHESGAGFTMIELIITIAILSFGIVSVYTAFSSINTVTSTASLRFTAAYLTQEGLEIIRNLRDNNFINKAKWSSGLTGCALGCQGDYKTGTPSQTPANKLKPYNDTNFLKVNSDGFYSYGKGITTQFKRKITITQPSGTDTLKVTVQVFWNYNGQPFSFQASEYLYNWH